MHISQDQFERFLKDISDCFFQNDFATWQNRVRLPLTIVARTGPVVLKTAQELRRNFDLYISASRVMRLDTIVRTPISLEDCGDGAWHGTYETRLISRSINASPPYVSTALLDNVDGHVKMSSILNARGHSDWTGDTER